MRLHVWVTMPLLLVLLTALAACGSKEPETELDRFIARTSLWEGEALDDTLRSIAAREPLQAHYANYLIGNRFYQAAGDSAMIAGWGIPSWSPVWTAPRPTSPWRWPRTAPSSNRW